MCWLLQLILANTQLAAAKRYTFIILWYIPISTKILWYSWVLCYCNYSCRYIYREGGGGAHNLILLLLSLLYFYFRYVNVWQIVCSAWSQSKKQRDILDLVNSLLQNSHDVDINHNTPLARSCSPMSNFKKPLLITAVHRNKPEIKEFSDWRWDRIRHLETFWLEKHHLLMKRSFVKSPSHQSVGEMKN